MNTAKPSASSFSKLSVTLALALFLGAATAVKAQDIVFNNAPVSVTNAMGDNVEFFAGASDADNSSATLSYTWASNAVVLAGQTADVLILTNVQSASAATYTVTVSDTAASASASATLTVLNTFNSGDELALWLRFDDGIGNPTTQSAMDGSGQGNNGSLQNFPSSGQWVAGVSGGALFYANTNGASNNVAVVNDAPDLNFTNNLAFTLSAWVCGSSYNYFQGSLFATATSPAPDNFQIAGAAIISKGYGSGGEEYEMDVYTNNHFRFYVRNAAGTSYVYYSTNVLTPGVWQHVVATFDGNVGTMAMYVNGLTSASALAYAAPNSLSYSSEPVTIGNRQSSSITPYNSPFVGVIDDARIYGYALSASDVLALYHSYPTTALPSIYAGPLAPPIYAGGNMPLWALQSGLTGVTNQWQFNGSNPISPTNTAQITIGNLAAGNNGTATLIAGNTAGTTQTSVAVTGLTPYPQAAAVMALNPLAFWQLNESNPTSGATAVAYDYANGNNAIIGGAMITGQSGVSSPYNGFPPNYQAGQTVQVAGGYVTLPPFGLTNTNQVTFTAWLNPGGNASQATSAGLIYCRQSGQAGGMAYNGRLGYTWNNNSPSTYDWESGLVLSNNCWSFAAIVISSSNTVAYLGGTNSILYSATNALANTVTADWTTPGNMFIGHDPNSATIGTVDKTRIFMGQINNVAIFTGALQAAQIQSLYYSGGLPPTVGGAPVSVNVNQGQSVTLSNNVTGQEPMTYMVYATNGAASNFVTSGTVTDDVTNLAVTLSNLQTAQNGATFYIQVSNAFGVATAQTLVNVFAAPTVTLGPLPAAAEVYAGQSVTFLVDANGALPLYYQWATNGTPIAGATTSRATIDTAGLPLGSYTVSCRITNSVNGIAATASLEVAPNPSASYPLQVLALNPSGYWRLNEPDDGLGDNNDGQTCHDYVSGLNGLYTNTTLGNPGYNSADAVFANYDPETSAGFGFDSSENCCAYNIPGIDVSAGAGTNRAFTVTAWVYGYNYNGTAPGIASKGYFDNEEFTLDTGASGESYRFEIRNAAGTAYNANSSIPANDQKWHLLAGVCDEPNGLLTLYIDGTNAGSTVVTPGMGIMASDASIPMAIGARSSSPANGFDNQFGGYVNDVAFFPYALSVSQAQQLYDSSGAAPSVDLAANSITVGQNGTAIAIGFTNGTPPLSLQWDYIDNNGNTQILAGKTNNILTLTDVQPAQAQYQYYLVASNAYGMASNTTALTLNVLQGLSLNQDLSPDTLQVYAGLTKTYSVQAAGTEPITYTWQENGAEIPGATNASYTFAVQEGANTYQCQITNSTGNTSSSLASMTGVAAPTDPAGEAMVYFGPLAFWRLNEPSGATTAYDYVGGFNGTYGASTTNGLPGIPNPPFTGVPENDLGVWMDTNAGVVNGVVTTPSLNLTLTNATLTCWIYPNGSQYLSPGLVFSRGSTANGISQISGQVGYTWDNSASTFDWASGLVIPQNQWSFLALTITPSNGVTYLFNEAARGVATNSFANPAVAITSGFIIGADPSNNVSTRMFSGEIDDVAVFDYALSGADVGSIYARATGAALTVSIARSDANVVVSWPYGTLYQAPTLEGPWTPVSAASPYTLAPSGEQMYYRAMGAP